MYIVATILRISLLFISNDVTTTDIKTIFIFPPASVVEGIKSVRCVCLCVCVSVSWSALSRLILSSPDWLLTQDAISVSVVVTLASMLRWIWPNLECNLKTGDSQK